MRQSRLMDAPSRGWRMFQRMTVAALLALTLSGARAEAADERRGLFTVRATFLTGVPDYLSGGLTVNAIPAADVELGATLVLPVFASLYVRAGPRWTLYDGRDADARGFTARLAALGGPRLSALYSPGDTRTETGLGLNAVAALDGTYWIFRHLGVSAQLAAGATAYFPLRRPWHVLLGPLTPDVRLSFGVCF